MGAGPSEQPAAAATAVFLWFFFETCPRENVPEFADGDAIDSSACHARAINTGLAQKIP
jgi:hypothetical protein